MSEKRDIFSLSRKKRANKGKFKQQEKQQSIKKQYTLRKSSSMSSKALQQNLHFKRIINSIIQKNEKYQQKSFQNFNAQEDFFQKEQDDIQQKIRSLNNISSIQNLIQNFSLSQSCNNSLHDDQNIKTIQQFFQFQTPIKKQKDLFQQKLIHSLSNNFQDFQIESNQRIFSFPLHQNFQPKWN